MSPLEDCPRQGCVYLPGQGGWKQHTGAPSDLQGGSCYLPCGPSALLGVGVGGGGNSTTNASSEQENAKPLHALLRYNTLLFECQVHQLIL